MATGAITKTGTLATTSPKPVRVANWYVWFGYNPLKNCYHIRGKFSTSINADPINMIHEIQQSTKEGLNKELEGYFKSSKAIN